MWWTFYPESIVRVHAIHITVEMLLEMHKLINFFSLFQIIENESDEFTLLGKTPDSYEWSDGDKDAIEDANEVWELAMQKHKRPTLYFGLKTSFLEELIFF